EVANCSGTAITSRVIPAIRSGTAQDRRYPRSEEKTVRSQGGCRGPAPEATGPVDACVNSRPALGNSPSSRWPALTPAPLSPQTSRPTRSSPSEVPARLRQGAKTDRSVDLFKSKAWTEVHEGGFFYVPPGGIHAFWNSSDVPVSMLMLFAPGNARERY